MAVKLISDKEIASPRLIGVRNDERLNWTDNSSIQKLLDVIASILAEEYIEIAKRNPDVFLDSCFYPLGTFRRRRISLRLTREKGKGKRRKLQ